MSRKPDIFLSQLEQVGSLFYYSCNHPATVMSLYLLSIEEASYVLHFPFLSQFLLNSFQNLYSSDYTETSLAKVTHEYVKLNGQFPAFILISQAAV